MTFEERKDYVDRYYREVVLKPDFEGEPDFEAWLEKELKKDEDL